MDNPELTSVNSPNINSVLKPPKHRVPLKDLMAAAPEEENTAARKRRVSFANVNKIKEFSAGAESMVVCHTPAYEEPFSVSSDSSYPSGVDGWTPVKGQPSIHFKPPIYSEKENISIQSSRISTGMDFTSVVRHSVQNTRYSVNGMDLTEVANSHETLIDQQSRYSASGLDLTNVVGHPIQNTRYSASGLDFTNVVGHPIQNTRYSASGMDLTNVVGHPIQNTRYSASGMDLTNMVNSHQSILDHRTRFSMGMDFTSVIGHSAQNTRCSINGMDLTDAVNPHQSFFDSGSTRFSVGMNMTNVVGNSIRRRSSCNDMELTEVGNPYIYQDQDCEGGLTADDPDALELTEVVNCAQFSVASPKHKINDVRHSLKENVLYSVNNTRYSSVNMDISRTASSRLSTARRKSSRYSLEGMDLTEVVNNSCDDLEFTEVVRDPSIRAGSTRNSMCELDLTEGVVVGEGETRLSADSIDHTNVVGDKLGFSADTTLCGSMNLTTALLNLDSPKHNIFPNKRLKKAGAPTILSQEDPLYTDSKLSVMNLCSTSYESLAKVTGEYPTGEYPTGDSHNVNHCINKQVVHESQCNIMDSEKSGIVSGEFKDKLFTPIVSESKSNGSNGVDEHEELNITMNSNNPTNFPLLQNESVVRQKETSNVKQKGTNCMDSVTPGILEPSNGRLINYSEICETTNLEHDYSGNESPHLDSGISVIELKLNETGQTVNNAGDSPNRTEEISAQQHNSCTVSSEDSEPLCDDGIGISITGKIDNEEYKSIVTEVACSDKIEHPETTLKCPEVIFDLNESFTNMSMEKYGEINKGENVEHSSCQQDKKNHFSDDNVICVSALNDCESNQKVNIESNFVQKENHQTLDKNITAKSPSIHLNFSPDSSINLSSRSLLYNQNITMTRGRSKSLIIFPETSLEISKNESSIVDGESSSFKSTPGVLKPTDHANEDRLNEPENNFSYTVDPPQTGTSCENRGKRSFEEALEPENDIEESPNKQICLSREDPLEEHEILSNVTAPSFLMNTLNAPNETVPSLEHHETTAVTSEPTSPIEKNMKNIILNSTSKKMSETKQEFSLRMDDSLFPSMSGNPLHHEVIDLCESSFDATTTEVRDLINNSRYKTKTVHDADISTKENEGLHCTTKNKDNVSFCQGDLGQMPQPSLTKGFYSNKSVTKDDCIESNFLEKEVENMCLSKNDQRESSRISMATQLKFGSRRRKEIVETLGNNSYVADFIPNFIEIHFSIDSHGMVSNVNYRTICAGGSSAIGEYLLRQVENHVLPVKGSDLILELQSTNKSYLARLARNINLICKYHNGSLKGNILTLEIASCRNHFWTLIDVNIKHPQYLNQTDITISDQKIGELKLSLVRKVFSSIEKNEDKLLNFARKITELQYSN